MADQAAMNPVATPRTNGNGNAMIGGIGSFGSNLATLATLQARLAACDLKEYLQQAAPYLAVLFVAALLGLASITVALFGAGHWIVSATGLSVAAAFGVLGGTVLAVSGVLAWLAARQLGKGLSSFRRSSEELDRNLAWIRTVLTHSGR